MKPSEKTLRELGLTYHELVSGYDRHDRTWMMQTEKHPPTAKQLQRTLCRVVCHDQLSGLDRETIGYATLILKDKE